MVFTIIYCMKTLQTFNFRDGNVLSYAGPVQVYQTCMLVGTILQNYMTAG